MLPGLMGLEPVVADIADGGLAGERRRVTNDRERAERVALRDDVTRRPVRSV